MNFISDMRWHRELSSRRRRKLVSNNVVVSGMCALGGGGLGWRRLEQGACRTSAGVEVGCCC
eukprot:3504805-Pleurochrysis_carterae.AAC.2